MNILFAEILKKLRRERELSQRELAEQMYVTRSTVARWETGSRLPDAAMISRLAGCLGTDITTLLSAAAKQSEAQDAPGLCRPTPTDGLVPAQAQDAPGLCRPTPMDGLVPGLCRPQVIMVDDRKIFLSGALPVLEDALPGAAITGFTKPSEALEFARANPVALAFLDIEMGKTSGLDLCRELLALNPCTNVIYLTAYIEYSFDAWSTGASGFLLKPLTAEAVRAQLKMRPHFIYNAMMSIYYLCTKDPKKAQQVTLDFTTYLRKNFTALASVDSIPFADELEHTRAYLAVEQVQFEERLFVEYDTPHKEFRLPPLTLQPIVENAVKHGMDPESAPLHITIRTRRTPSGSQITVEDNGPGFAPEESLPRPDAPDRSHRPHIALANIRERLQMQGDSLTIRPREGGGTVVRVTITKSHGLS